MELIDYYRKGLLFVTYLLINAEQEISDHEMYYLHKMRVKAGMTDDAFAEYFKSLLGKSEREIYQIGIESLNRCPQEFKMKAFSILNNMAMVDKVLNQKEVRFIQYATLTN